VPTGTWSRSSPPRRRCATYASRCRCASTPATTSSWRSSARSAARRSASTRCPERLIQAFLAGEDDRYFEHPGVDWQGLTRAVLYLVRTGEKGPGGSTITMQVARNFFLTREKTYIRKLNEILLALKIEREFSKEEILELYVNKIFLGQRAYGVGAAAQVYYGRTVTSSRCPSSP